MESIEVSINFLRPTKTGDRFSAVSMESHLGRSTGLYTINVTDQTGKNVAFKKATAYRFDQSLVK